MRYRLTFIVSLVAVSIGLDAQQPAASGYRLPPKVIVDMLDAPPPPTAEVSPARDVVAMLERPSMPTIAELAQPFHRLAGLRINPRTNAPHRAPNQNPRYRNLTLRVIADNSERKVTLPASPVISWIGFNADGRRFAFTQMKGTGVELWVGETATGQARAVTPAQLNAVFGSPCSWIGEGGSLLCSFINTNRGPAPAAPAVPSGPNVQESRGEAAPAPTVQDMLTSAYDETLFEYYGAIQLAIVDATSGQRAPIGTPALYTNVEVSPDGQFVLVTRTKRPFSWILPFRRFPRTAEIWDRRGALVKQLADLPMANDIPRGGVLPGPRSWQWHPTQPATVVYAEALDGGDPRKTVEFRDRILTLAAPFTAAPTELTKTQFRFESIAWTSAGSIWLQENDRATRKVRTWVIDSPGATPRKLFERSDEDAYNNPGDPLKQLRNSGREVLFQNGDTIFMTGVGSSPQGDRPFLDRINLKTGQKERLFQTEDQTYERVLALLSDDGSRFITRFETRSAPPQIAMRGREAGSRRTLASVPDPAPALQGVKSQMVTYKRADGVQLRTTVHTPPGWTPDQGRLPALLWAYPREFSDPEMAGQVTGSQYRFTSPGWSTLHMMFLTQGYAIIDDPTMPIVGPGETANDTYIEQLVASAQAAVDKAVDMGIVDRDRIVAGGHSYGAFMTANLLAHSDIFRAGIARSGAYNRTLTPFGFQNEERTFWQVPQLYARMSPFNYADKIKEPILLIHGEADDNAGTYPVQSERFYRALKGHGATVRYVTLPHEAHGYAARESVLHTVAEMLNWANEWTKPRATATQQQQ
ncbi:MAG TPA: prolyl oligopeptidase family serine peptidase [Vicinamibacterales bacterium]|nr:prolyl oligopeptidase family serine peptidase [Vicinamibacterales bacterium]